MSEFEGPRGLRGYASIALADGGSVEVQQSSCVVSFTEHGAIEGPFVWLRAGDESAHLSAAEAIEVRDALSTFLRETGIEPEVDR